MTMEEFSAANRATASTPQLDAAEWADWAGTGNDRLPDLGAMGQRQAYERNVSALWRDVRGSIVAAIGAVNSQLPEPRRVECAESSTRGLALTRWSEYPVAFLDISVDVDSGMIGCLYSFAAD